MGPIQTFNYDPTLIGQGNQILQGLGYDSQGSNVPLGWEGMNPDQMRMALQVIAGSPIARQQMASGLSPNQVQFPGLPQSPMTQGPVPQLTPPAVQGNPSFQPRNFQPRHRPGPMQPGRVRPPIGQPGGFAPDINHSLFGGSNGGFSQDMNQRRQGGQRSQGNNLGMTAGG